MAKKIHEFKNEILLNYVGEFEMVGNLSLGDQISETHIRFGHMGDFESYIKAIVEKYEAKDAIFEDYIYKIDIPQFFNLIIGSQYGNGSDFKHETFEYHGNNCFIPTKGYCFVKCIKYLTGEDSRQQYLDFIRNDKRRSNIMTMAHIQPFCRANNINLGSFVGTKVFLDRLLIEVTLCFYTIIIFVYYGNLKIIVLFKLLKNWKMFLK